MQLASGVSSWKHSILDNRSAEDSAKKEVDEMPAFANPFQANVERQLTKKELIQAVRLDIAGELEAIYSMTHMFRQRTVRSQRRSCQIFVMKRKHI